MGKQKSVLIINRSAPYAGSTARESLDVVLTCSIFELPVSLVFSGDAIFQLLNNQNPADIGQKSIGAMLSALPMYDVENIYVIADDLARYGLSTNDLILPVTSISSAQIAALINQHNTVLTF